MAAVGQGPGNDPRQAIIAKAQELLVRGQKASQMIADGKELRAVAKTGGQGDAMLTAGRKIRDTVINAATALAESGAPQGAKMQGGIVPVATDAHRVAAAVVAHLARDRAEDSFDIRDNQHARDVRLFGIPADPKIVSAPNEDLQLARGAADTSRFDEQGNPAFAPAEHLTAVEIMVRQARAARETAVYGPVEASADGVGSAMLVDLKLAREAVQYVRSQRQAPNLPPEMAAELQQLEPIAYNLVNETASAVEMLAKGMIVAMAGDAGLSQLAAGNEGVHIALAGIAKTVLERVDTASFGPQVTPEIWFDFVQRFADDQLGELAPLTFVDGPLQQAVPNYHAVSEIMTSTRARIAEAIAMVTEKAHADAQHPAA